MEGLSIRSLNSKRFRSPPLPGRCPPRRAPLGRGPGDLSRPPLGSPRGKSCTDRGAGGRSQRRGRRAAPGREEAEPERVGGERPGLRRGGGGPAGTAASASKNFLGTASPGGRQTGGMTVRARGGRGGSEEKKTP
ncbi:Collagen Alpha-5(Vi) Chain [Manis pentadactyla]|nr:Collagen Alpha-5(Vi) Chain [Manis pentadactyla]